MAQTTKRVERERETSNDEHQSGSRVEELAGGAREAVASARGAAGEIVGQLPTAAAATKAAMDEASRQMESTSDVVLAMGSAFAFGIALGLFISGTNRFAVTTALVPAVAMTMTLIDRRSRGSLETLAGS